MPRTCLISWCRSIGGTNGITRPQRPGAGVGAIVAGEGTGGSLATQRFSCRVEWLSIRRNDARQLRRVEFVLNDLRTHFEQV